MDGECLIYFIYYMWFHEQDILLHNIIDVNNIHGYVLPHASTKYTGKIISHTLQFKPSKMFKHIYILYYPSQKDPNINGKYYHEFYVPFKSLKYVIKKYWKIHDVEFIGVNVSLLNNIKIIPNSLVVVSADFSHRLPLQKAIKLENKAAHALMFRYLDSPFMKVVDDVRTFELLYKIIPENWGLQWIGRTRSPGVKGVGYLSFFIKSNSVKRIPDGIFITAYDSKMNSRECLGEWFSHSKLYSKTIENELKNKVIKLGEKDSRLTGGRNIHLPIKYYSVTYLYREKHNLKIIRGWHGIKYNAFYLPNVLLEHTFDNGQWIKNTDIKWFQKDEFDVSDTLSKLNEKSGIYDKNSNIELYYSNYVCHKYT